MNGLLRDTEEAIRILRHSHWTLAAVVLKAVILGMLFGLLLFVPISLIKFGAVLGWIGALSYILYEFLLWYYDIYIITNERLIDINQKRLFHREISEVALRRVNDVSYEIKGFFPTFFNVGTVRVYGGAEPLSLTRVSDPAGTKALIRELCQNQSPLESPSRLQIR